MQKYVKRSLTFGFLNPFYRPKCVFCGSSLKRKIDTRDRVIESPTDSNWGWKEKSLPSKPGWNKTWTLVKYPYLQRESRNTWRCIECGTYNEDSLVSNYNDLMKKIEKVKKKIQKKFPAIIFNAEFIYEDGQQYDPNSKRIFDKVTIELKTEETYWKEICFLKDESIDYLDFHDYYFEPLHYWNNVKDYKNLCKLLLE